MEKFLTQISSAKTVDEIVRLRNTISISYTINRRTNEGRKNTEELLWLCTKRLNEMVDKEGLNPF